MITKPPNWKSALNSKQFSKAFESAQLQELIKHTSKEYVYWDKFKYYTFPSDLTAEEAWAYLKFSRMINWERTPVSDKNKQPFVFSITKHMYQKLSFIDSNTSGLLQTSLSKPTESQKNQLIISGLAEEAIASSQIEGASTSRKVAKEMILAQRKPRNRDEQMIINNYQVMQRLMDWKELDLSKSMLLDIQKNITTKTLDDEKDAGKFRSDTDDIKVVDRLSGHAVFVPPTAEFFQRELDNLVNFANRQDEEFIHPIIKASILHFWLAYLHPFVDGNGRTARAIMYWYLLKHKYWLFQYLSVSRAIKKSRSQYDEAYLKTEYDDDDLTYFILYSLKTIETAIKDFTAHYEAKIESDKKNELLSKRLKQFNHRQIALLSFLQENPGNIVDMKTHQTKNQIAYQTARTDLQQLAEKGLVAQIADGKKYVFVPNIQAIRKLLSA